MIAPPVLPVIVIVELPIMLIDITYTMIVEPHCSEYGAAVKTLIGIVHILVLITVNELIPSQYCKFCE